MILSVPCVRHRDVEPIWEVTTQSLFYASPVLYVSTLVDFDRTAPDVVTAIGGAYRRLLPLALIVGVLLLGVWLFNREVPRIAEHV